MYKLTTSQIIKKYIHIMVIIQNSCCSKPKHLIIY